MNSSVYSPEEMLQTNLLNLTRISFRSEVRSSLGLVLESSVSCSLHYDGQRSSSFISLLEVLLFKSSTFFGLFIWGTFQMFIVQPFKERFHAETLWECRSLYTNLQKSVLVQHLECTWFTTMLLWKLGLGNYGMLESLPSEKHSPFAKLNSNATFINASCA